MNQAQAAPPFAKPLRFPDVDAATLAREEQDAARFVVPGDRSWDDYLRRILRSASAGAHRPRLVSRG